MGKALVVLYLFESPTPRVFNAKTLGFGELRIIASVPTVKKVIALGRSGKSFYHTNQLGVKRTALEKKIEMRKYKWSGNAVAYYLSWLPLFMQGWRICRNEKINIIHAESPHISGLAAIILGKLFKIKVIVEYKVSYESLAIYRYGKLWGSILNTLFWIVAGAVMRKADYVLGNSKTYADYLKKRLNLKRVRFYNPAVVVPHDFKREKHQGTVVGFIGRLYADKGPRKFVELVDYGKDWFRQKGVTFLLAGSGPEKSILRELIKKNNLDDLIYMVGTMDRWEFFSKIEMCVNTTAFEVALEMTIVEAAMVGIPTLAFGEDNIPETVVSGRTGFLVQRNNINDLYIKLKKLIADVELYTGMSKSAIIYSRKYANDNQVNNLKKIYMTYVS